MIAYIEGLMLAVAIVIALVMAWKYSKAEKAMLKKIESLERVLGIADDEFERSIKDKRTTKQPKSKMFYNGRASAFAEMLLAINNSKEAKDEEV